jgi:MYXO-CTERM domain-containing protein
MRFLFITLAALLLSAPFTASAQQCESPGVLVVLDRSISMQGEIDQVTKWDIARGALDGMLMTHGDAAHFGLMLYPGPSGSGANGVDGPVPACNYNRQDAGCTPDAPRCTTGEVVVNTGANTRQAILDATIWPADLRHSYTPTWQSLEAADSYPGIRQVGRRNFVVLVTDGWQCCGLYTNADGSLGCEPEDRNLVIEKVAQLNDHGVRTFVVGFGGRVDVQTLQGASIAGGASRPGCDPDAEAAADDRCYYQADNAIELQTMLDDIVRRIAEEICDGQDNDCDGSVDEDLSRACESDCGPGQQSCLNGAWVDCNAANPAAETCNGIDDDCDGEIDENLSRACNGACGAGEEICRDGVWNQCDARLPNPEQCNGIDDDCDGTIDEDCECRPNETRDCGNDIGVCAAGQQTCQPDGTWGPCDGASDPQPEMCNGLDDDCDGTVDNLERACNTACGDGVERCMAGEWSECNAPVAGEETCDGRDQDCDGRTDEDLTRGCETICGQGVETCDGGAWGTCNAPQPVPEVCGNGADDDCDGEIDDGCECTDGDTQPCGRADGICEQGAQTCADGAWGDCQGATTGTDETCNGLDDDCDGVSDEGSLCGDGQFCACGGCADACEANECAGGLSCTSGFCIEDNCPAGFICETGSCVEGEPADMGVGPDAYVAPSFDDAGVTITGSGASEGCSCDLNDTDRPAWPALFLFGLLGLVRRRR